MATVNWRALAPLLLILGCGDQPEPITPGGTPTPDCSVDEERFFHPDGDGDTYPAPADSDGGNLVLACEAPDGYVAVDDPASTLYDCDDANGDVYPGALEGAAPEDAGSPYTADGIDNDCDETIDEGTEVRDDDGDQFCEIGFDINGDGDCLDVNEGEPLFADCDDGNACAEGDLECLGQAATRNPQASEGFVVGGQVLGTGFDNDCDGAIDEGTANGDDDQDGFCEAGLPVYFSPSDGSVASTSEDDSNPWPGYCGAPGDPQLGDNGERLPGSCVCSGSPDDVNPALIDCADDPDLIIEADTIYPGAEEIPYDGIDQNCDGADIADLDADGFESNLDCNDGGACYQALLLCQGEGTGDAADPLPCEDLYTQCLTEAAMVNPEGVEIPYDNIDQDCSGYDVGDVDGDGYCSTYVLNENGDIVEVDGEPLAYDADPEDATPGDPMNAPGLCQFPQGDCDDSDPSTYPGADETGAQSEFETDEILFGDSKDNDCDGLVDEGTLSSDDDRDGFCERGFPVGFVLNPGEPEPTASQDALNAYCGGAPETWPTYEVEIDGEIISRHYQGACLCTGDMNGDGIPDVVTQDALKDCDDSEPTTHPGAHEFLYDEVDQDCDGYDDADFDKDGYCLGGLVGYDYAFAECDFIERDCNDGIICDEDNNNCQDIPRGEDGEYSDAVEIERRAGANVNPGQGEIPYDGLDQDCDGLDSLDVDQDGFCPSTSELEASCGDACDDVFGGCVAQCEGAEDQSQCEAICSTHLEACGADCSDIDQLIDLQTCPRADSGSDCNDVNPAIYPGAPEDGLFGATDKGDGVDNNCNGIVDEFTVHRDDDADGFCEDGLKVTFTPSEPLPDTPPEGVGPWATYAWPGYCGPEEERDQRLLSPDGDPYRGDCLCNPLVETEYTLADCDDTNPDRYPGNEEVPYDRIDQDCDPLELDEADVDGDGHCKAGLSAAGYTYGLAYCPEGIGDCDDEDAAVNPEGEEGLGGDAKDNDCDGDIDEGTLDNDDDGDGVSEADGDCDDANDDVFPGATDTPYDGIDQNCDGFDLADVDGDGHCKAGLQGYNYGSALCALGIGDCDDENDGINPGATEIPGNGLDEDCDGVDAEDLDLDDDGFTAADGDCDDRDQSVFPCVGDECPPEPADGADNDCDGCIDEGNWDVGDVLISEVMANPIGQDSNREYIELHNTGEDEAFVNGFSIGTEEDNLMTLGAYAPATQVTSGVPLAIGPGGRLLILKTDNESLNGGINTIGLNAYVYDRNTWALPNSEGRLYLSVSCSDGYEDVDSMDYAPGVVLGNEGVAAEVDRGYLLDPEEAPYALCDAVSTYGDEGNLGSPGQINDRCVDEN